MKKIILLMSLIVGLLANDVVVFKNEFHVLKLDKKVRKLLIGNKEMINVSLLSAPSNRGTTLKIFGKKTGNTSILIKNRDGSIVNYHVYVNENLGFVQKMINMIEPSLKLSKVGKSSTVIMGTFKDPHNKKRIYAILTNAGIDLTKLMDLTKTKEVNKMIRTKLYLVEINNQKAKNLGGITGMSFFSKYLSLQVNPSADNGATFSGWLLNQTGSFTSQTGTSITATLNFLQNSGIGKILDDTVLMTTEDKNASFRVGGDVFIPIGLTQNVGFAPTIQLEKKEYGLFLTLKSQFMEKDGYMHINVDIEDSEFDTNKDHDVQLGDHISVPSFIAKNIKTNVVVKSGQVIALGGRLHTEEIDREEKVPFLGDIPLLGELFTHTVSGTKANDLLFFLVPEIVDANQEIDDTHFYKGFKKEASIFHKSATDLNETQDVKDDNNSMVVHNDTQEDKVVAKDTANKLMIIEVEDDATDDINSTKVSKEIVVPLKKTPVSVKPKKIEVEKKTSNAKATENEVYSVSTDKIFLRSKPSDGIEKTVWKKGHKFTVSEKKVINGIAWFKVDKNCYKDCEKESRELWLSSKYVEKE